MLFGVWKRRTCLETQGVSWYVRPLMPSLVTVGLVMALSTTASTSAAGTVAAGTGLVAAHLAAWLVVAASRRRGRGLHPTLIIGRTECADRLAHRMQTYPEAGLCLGWVYTPLSEPDTDARSGARLVDRILDRFDAEHVLYVGNHADETVFRDFVRFGAGRVNCSVVLPLGGLCAGQTGVRLGDLGVIPIRLVPSWGSNLIKRVFDVLAASILLIVLSPLLALTAAAIRIGDSGPALFHQTRVGRGGQRFTVFKFRSMVVDAEDRRAQYLHQNINGGGLLFKLEGDPRITRVGQIIRRLSIDELPQLLNVLRGDMSLVGPRPLPVEPD
ncbi:MAG: sugar transferase, partial [Actinomycetes bacterium]